MSELVPTLIAIDPGDPHCGVARFERDPFNHWKCVWAKELTPFELGRFLEKEMPLIDVVVYETFQIYPDKAKTLIGSKCETAQTIGMVRWLVLSYNGDTQLVDLHEQPAAIKTPTLSMLRSKGLKSVAVRNKQGGHAKDAETHGWCYLFQNGLYDA